MLLYFCGLALSFIAGFTIAALLYEHLEAKEDKELSIKVQKIKTQLNTIFKRKKK
jgi:hypothetical protein